MWEYSSTIRIMSCRCEGMYGSPIVTNLFWWVTNQFKKGGLKRLTFTRIKFKFTSNVTEKVNFFYKENGSFFYHLLEESASTDKFFKLFKLVGKFFEVFESEMRNEKDKKGLSFFWR